MENLTKQQIILVTLLVSFVTSIATGIVTVSLMDQTPKAVTQTINRVVERTIEKITPVPSDEKQTTIKETIVVNQDDQIVGAIEKNSKILARIYRTSGDVDVFSGLGTWITADGGLVTTAHIVLGDGEVLKAKTSDGNYYQISLVGKAEGISLYQIKSDPNATSSNTIKLSTAKFSDQELKLGQSVISLSGEKSDYVLSALVSGFLTKKIYSDEIVALASSTEATTTTNAITNTNDRNYSYIQTSLSSSDMPSGTLLINLTGDVVGMNIRSENAFVPVSLLKTAISEVK